VLQDLLLGRFSPADPQPLLSHLEVCDQCAAQARLLHPDDHLDQAVRDQMHLSPAPCPASLGELMEQLRALHAVVPAGEPNRTDHFDSPSGQQPTSPGVDLVGFLAPADGPGELGRLGTYRVRRVLGHGGMGVVFLAEDPHLERSVALKAMLPNLAASTLARQRFLREGKAAAAIAHEHIVSIYQVGEDRGVPYLAMQLLHGESLEQRLERDRVFPVVEVLRIGREIAEGLAAAHDCGVIHRDVKPANIWLEADKGKVKLLDFGLARAAAVDGQRLTHEGAIIGTPGFMSPEQVNGHGVEAGSDLFSLGCVLYVMATGVQPFEGTDLTSILLAVARGRPRRPQELQPDLPPALAALILNLLARKPADRPESARKVVEVIAAIEADTGVRPESIGLRSYRRPRGRLMMAMLCLAIAAGALTVFALRSRPEGADVVSRTEGDFEIVSRPNGAIVGLVNFKTREQWDLHEGGHRLASVDEPEGLRLDLGDGGLVTLRRSGEGIAVEHLLEPVPDTPPAAEELARRRSPLDLWNGENVPKGMFPDLKKSRDALHLVGVLGDTRFRFLGDPKYPAFSHDGRLLALPCDNQVLLFDLASGHLQRTLRGHSNHVLRVVFSPDSRTLVSTSLDGTVRRWDAQTGKELWNVAPLPVPIADVALSPDGTRGVSGGCSGQVLLWDAATGRETKRLAGHAQAVHGVAFRPPRGDIVATAGSEGTVRVWDTATGGEVHRFAHLPGETYVTFSPDGRLLLAASGGPYSPPPPIPGVKVLDVATWKEVAAIRVPDCWAVFTLDGRHVLAVERHRSDALAPAKVRRWDTATWREEEPLSLACNGEEIFSGLTDDGKTLALLSRADRAVRLFDLTSGRQISPGSGHTGEVAQVAFSPDGKTLVSGGKDGVVRIWDLVSRREPLALTGHKSEVRSVAFSPGGRLVASSSYDGTVRIWSAATGRALQTLFGHVGQVEQVAFDPRGRMLASAGADGTVRLWDLGGKEPRILRGHATEAVGLAFNPDGARIASGGADTSVRIWDIASGDALRTLQHSSKVNAVIFLDEGRKIAATGGDGTLAVWDVGTGARLRVLPTAGQTRHGLAGRQDGRRLAASGWDGTISLWEPALAPSGDRMGLLVTPLYPMGNSVSGVAFSPEGRHLAATSPSGTLLLFRLPTELPLWMGPSAAQSSPPPPRLPPEAPPGAR
jgi:WD40 repeat protein